MANNLGLDPFPDPVGHFEAPWWPFWIFEVLIEGMVESKNLFNESWSEGPIARLPGPDNSLYFRGLKLPGPGVAPTYTQHTEV